MHLHDGVEPLWKGLDVPSAGSHVFRGETVYAQILTLFQKRRGHRQVAYKKGLRVIPTISPSHAIYLKDVGRGDLPRLAFDKKESLPVIYHQIYLVFHCIPALLIENDVVPDIVLTVASDIGHMPIGHHVGDHHFPPASQEHQLAASPGCRVEEDLESAVDTQRAAPSLDFGAIGQSPLEEVVARFRQGEAPEPALGHSIDVVMPFDELLHVIGGVHVEALELRYVLEGPHTTAVQSKVVFVTDGAAKRPAHVVRSVYQITVLRDIDRPATVLPGSLPRRESHNLRAFGEVEDEFVFGIFGQYSLAHAHDTVHIVRTHQILAHLHAV